MHESNWKTWAVILVVMIGGSFELLKHLPGHQSAVWETANLHFTTGKPYSVRNNQKILQLPKAPKWTHVAGADSKALKEALEKYNAQQAQPTQGEFKDKNAPAKTAKKKDEDEWEEVIDPATGKKVKRKKKKDSKKDEKPKVEVAKLPELPKTPPQPEEDPNDIGGAVAQYAKQGQLPATGPAANAGFGTLEDWERRLLSRPNMAETQLFIREYHEHMVTPDIFYKITAMMMQDSRQDMKQLGVLCAGQTPSVQSFELLVSMSHSSSGQLQANTNTYLARYADSMNDLGTLTGVLHVNDPASQTVALQDIDKLANQFLRQGQGPTPNPGAQGNVSAYATRFQQLIGVITQLSKSSNSSVASQAQITLADLQSLLSASTVASTQ